VGHVASILNISKPHTFRFHTKLPTSTHPSRGHFLYPLRGNGAPSAVPTLKTDDSVITLAADGHTLFVREASGNAWTMRLVSIDFNTGKRQLFKEIEPPDLLPRGNALFVYTSLYTMPTASYRAVPCQTCGVMIALALIESDLKKQSIQPLLIDAFEAGCALCHSIKAYSPDEVVA